MFHAVIINAYSYYLLLFTIGYYLFFFFNCIYMLYTDLCNCKATRSAVYIVYVHALTGCTVFCSPVFIALSIDQRNMYQHIYLELTVHAGALCGSLLKSVCRCGLFLCLHAVSKKFIDFVWARSS